MTNKVDLPPGVSERSEEAWQYNRHPADKWEYYHYEFVGREWWEVVFTFAPNQYEVTCQTPDEARVLIWGKCGDKILQGLQEWFDRGWRLAENDFVGPKNIFIRAQDEGQSIRAWPRFFRVTLVRD